MKDKRIAVVGLGTGGSAVADMLARAGAGSVGKGQLILVDPDALSEENCKRHVLNRMWVGKSKVVGMAEHIFTVAPKCDTVLLLKKFDELRSIKIPARRWPGLAEGGGCLYQRQIGDGVFGRKPDLIVSCVDSLACESLINAYSLENKVPAVYGGVHGDAHTAEVITVIPGVTPCYECYEREGPLPEPGQEAYTDPGYDKTKMPHQEGLWCDVLMAAALQVQAVLGVLGIREKLSPLVLMKLRYPFTLEPVNQKPGCAICTDKMEALRGIQL